jgi:hypothetical protein
MTSRLKNSAGPTSRQACTMSGVRAEPCGARSRCLCAFSIMTIAASTMAPIAIAMPPRLMMFEFRPIARMLRNATSTPTGSMTMATSALRRCIRNSRHTSATTTHSSNTVRSSVSIARSISCERS